MSVVSVFLTRLDVRDAVCALLVPPAGTAEAATESALKAEFNGRPVKAALERVHRYVDEQLGDARAWGVREQSVRDELVGLLAAGSDADGEGPALEEADPEGDRDVAHQIIVALAQAYPLPRELRDALSVAE
ncbi:hypothetical protein [Streptomyces sp. BPTC-684]|uniref:hypothetical protein n=1 Tax=Streptomyces sp. BPTC-684 TaxID=3043734 RepID=UPI0024B26592|nr:hypothetical protein [Streptomyces sp. BPTC-684]WHM35618.1 hypothetical protein QIY60_00975 [Streptomyces sp. BPTC-684]